jgi:hypothetical protein
MRMAVRRPRPQAHAQGWRPVNSIEMNTNAAAVAEKYAVLNATSERAWFLVTPISYKITK